MKKILITFVLLISLLSLASCKKCKKDKTKDPDTLITAPTLEQWKDFGINEAFNVNIEGELTFSVVDNGEISMKWENSNEASLDSTIIWLKSQGFTSYKGQNAEKTVEEGGNIISYVAQKDITGKDLLKSTNNQNGYIMPLSLALNETGNKTMIVESFYIARDFSVMGQSFKAGELYLDIYESTDIIGASSLLTSWPTTQIQNVIETDIPAYNGNTSGYQFIDSSIGYIKTVQITVFGVSDDSLTQYKSTLTQSGYVLNDDENYSKTLTNGDVVEIMVYSSQTYHPDTFQIVDVINITAILEKNSGTYTSWDQLDLSLLNEIGLPKYNGGISFSIEEVEAAGIDISQYEQIIKSLEAFEELLDPETKAQLEEARLFVALASEIKSYIITIFGTSYDAVQEYEDALVEAGFVEGLKNSIEYQYQVEVEDDEEKAMIIITRLPIELAEEIEGDSGGGNNNQTGNESLSWEDLPVNVKFTVTESYGTQYTITKIGNDYLIEYYGMYTYVKYIDQSWTVYNYIGVEWIEGDTYTMLNSIDVMNAVDVVIFDNDVSDFIEAGTELVSGQNCKVYNYTQTDTMGTGFGINQTKKINEDGIVFYVEEITIFQGQPYMTVTREITLWDTSVSEFEIAIP